MAGVPLHDYQIDAILNMHNGCILCGGVGSGKSRTSLAYYYYTQGGDPLDIDNKPMEDPPQDLYIITTARKRDTLDWESEMVPFLLGKHDLYQHKVVVDSWNNIKKYKEVENAFFIFDEQRVVGYGAWTKSFLRISRRNNWILLSATPGDTWSDYIPVFIANGFYKNKTEFEREHVIWKPFTNFPQIDRYLNTGRLLRLRSRILVDMDFKRPTTQHHEDMHCEYDILTYKKVMKDRWNPFEDKPIENAPEFCSVLRRIVNTDPSRAGIVIDIFNTRQKVIIFYNYDYELDILRALDYGEGVTVAEWNGHKHEPIPDGDKWVYLVQYNANEGWNCTVTDTIIFYSQNYSYKVMVQAAGRIDRLNTPYRDLHYYHLKSGSSIDISISRALKAKKKFNESKFYNWNG